MNKFYSESVNEINVWNKHPNDLYKDVCSEKSVYMHYFIYEVERVINGEKTNSKLDIERIWCNTQLIKETKTVNT